MKNLLTSGSYFSSFQPHNILFSKIDHASKSNPANITNMLQILL